MEPFAPWLRVVIKSALDAMTINRTVPEIPVLFVMDEFLQLESFPEAIRAMRTLAGSGVRLWFFLQDVPGLEKYYPDDWKAFFTCAVRQYFGMNDHFTAEMLSRAIGNETRAHLNVSSGGNMTASQGSSPWEGGNSGFSVNTSESVQLLGRPLLSPDELTAKLSSWNGQGWRSSILQIATAGARPIDADLLDYSQIPNCTNRLGPHTAG
jgi:type IV secretion system protein VirD4